MKYLAEASKIENDEQRAQLDEQYTFVAEVSSLPRDKDIVSIKVLYFKSMIDIQKELHLPVFI